MKFNKLYKNLNLFTEEFLVKDLSSAFSQIKSYIEKKIGEKLYKYGGTYGFETYISSNGEETGIKMFIGDTTGALRFNIKNGKITSIDIWNANDNEDYPSIRIDTINTMSITKVLPFIIDQIKNPKTGHFEIIVDPEFSAKEKTKSLLGEAKITYKGKEFASKELLIANLIENGMRNIYDLAKESGSSTGTVKYVAKQLGALAEIDVIKGTKEISVLPDENKTVEMVNKISPKVMFEDMKHLVNMICDKTLPSLLITGQAGIGKTHTVIETIKSRGLKEDEDFVTFTGSSTAKGLYQTLFLNNDKLVIYDDSDSVLKDTEAVNILKGALDSKKVRKISWVSANTFDARGKSIEELKSEFQESGKLPNQFEFSGQIIFISNLPESKFDKAILSRSMTIDIHLSTADILERIEDILEKIEPQVDIKVKKQVLEYLKTKIDFFEKTNISFNLRSFLKSIQLRLSNSPDWQGLIDRYALK